MGLGNPAISGDFPYSAGESARLPKGQEVSGMRIEFLASIARVEATTESTSLDQWEVQAEDGRERVGPSKTGWALPVDPVQACAWSPA